MQDRLTEAVASLRKTVDRVTTKLHRHAWRGGSKNWYCTPCLRAGVDKTRPDPWLVVMLILKFGVWPEMSWWVTLWPLYGIALIVVIHGFVGAFLMADRCAFCGDQF